MNGYREYIAEDIDHLQQILFCRESRFTLSKIKELLAKLNFDRIEVFVNIGQMYSKDEEFIKDIEQYHAVLSSFLIKAMNSYMKNIQK